MTVYEIVSFVNRSLVAIGSPLCVVKNKILFREMGILIIESTVLYLGALAWLHSVHIYRASFPLCIRWGSPFVVGKSQSPAGERDDAS